MTAIEVLESSALREAHPHLFPEELTRESIGTNGRGELVIPGSALALILRWAAENPATAKDVAGHLDSL